MSQISAAEMDRRIKTALSLIQQRKYSDQLMEMVRLTLLGATIQDLLDLERMHK